MHTLGLHKHPCRTDCRRALGQSLASLLRNLTDNLLLLPHELTPSSYLKIPGEGKCTCMLLFLITSQEQILYNLSLKCVVVNGALVVFSECFWWFGRMKQKKSKMKKSCYCILFFFLETSVDENGYIETIIINALGDKHLDLLILLVFTSFLLRSLKHAIYLQSLSLATMIPSSCSYMQNSFPSIYFVRLMHRHMDYSAVFFTFSQLRSNTC